LAGAAPLQPAPLLQARPQQHQQQTANGASSLLQRPTVLPPRRINRRQIIARAGHQAQTPTTTTLTTIVPQAALPSLSLHQPSVGLPFQDVEVLYFDLFRTQTASELSGYFDAGFWTQRVLQECHSEAAVRHAAVALGALYKTLEQSTKSPSPTGSDADESGAHADAVLSHWQVAIRQYSAACNAIMLLDNDARGSNRTRLMASVLLGSFDAFIGDHKQAIIQLQSGLGLLKRLQAQQAQPQQHDHHHRYYGGDEAIEPELVAIFTRLAIQAKSYDLAFHFPEPYVIRLTPDAPEPAPASASAPYPEKRSPFSERPDPNRPFTSLRDARAAFDRLLSGGMRFLERLNLAMQKPSRVFPESWKQYGAGFMEDMAAWAAAFEPIFQARDADGLSHQERAAVAALKMSQVNTQTLFMSLFGSTETQFDAFQPQFEQVVALGEEIVGADERRAAADRCPYPEFCLHRRWDQDQDSDGLGPGAFSACHIKPSFSADLGIVPPLFVVATKCRQPLLRRRAIRLLRSSARREGMWDSELAARIGQYIMSIEEYEEPVADNVLYQQGVLPPRLDTAFTYNGTPAAYPPSKVNQHVAMPRVIPEEKRVMIRSVDFDLRSRFADLTIGTRSARVSSPPEEDRQYRETHISW
jgi:hypothetical protein